MSILCAKFCIVCGVDDMLVVFDGVDLGSGMVVEA
jgi:hypothetical protein